MTPQQLQLMQQLLMFTGMIVSGFGWMTSDQWTGISTAISQFAGPAVVLGSAIWTFVTSRKSAIISQVATLKDSNGVNIVKNVNLNPNSVETPAISAATPSNVSAQTPPPPVGGVGSLGM